MAAMDEFLLVGGDDGSFTFMNLQTCESPVFGTFTNGEFMEVNSIEISFSRTGVCVVSIWDHWKHVRPFRPPGLPTPDGHMIGVVGDDFDALVMSVNSQETIATLKGHQRYSFSIAWSPDSRMIATGSDDRSTYIYDTRKMTDPVHILSKDIVDSVRSLRYSPCGRYLVMAEDRNFIHVVDTTTDYSVAQKIDFVGDISGISLTPDGEGLFVGVSSVSFSIDSMASNAILANSNSSGKKRRKKQASQDISTAKSDLKATLINRGSIPRGRWKQHVSTEFDDIWDENIQAKEQAGEENSDEDEADEKETSLPRISASVPLP
ncbi:hypothetical protein BGZ65_006425 [Modicella reniformis]|uniref:Uncharacterized protein n=1 Tax=Modicella reniformis TaxID=1440133 RepID=A0A9P6LSI1_9FUNG|nr:hypothetical protein BGZ65_006425 [Modicella reniformis]